LLTFAKQIIILKFTDLLKYYHHNNSFALECGCSINGLTIAYHTFGTPNADCSNVIWVCHALTANSDVADWWPHTVEKGKFLDPEQYFIVCANVLGSNYGTTGPLSVNPDTGEKWYGDFPKVTVRDIVAAHRLLAAHLGIDHVLLLIGSSLGGFQCMEWALADPDFARNVALIATAPYTTPWAAAFNESQRMAIDADATYGNRDDNAGAAGLSAARSIALLSYRGATAYNLTQTDMSPLTVPPFKRRVHSYQQHQGNKLCNRFNAYSYYRLSQTVDSHDVARGRGALKDVLRTFKPRALVVAISSDILFTPEDHQPFVSYIPNVTYHLIDSSYGHDGFLIEHEKLDTIIKDFLSNQ
jgi:homoserine O-acetyltransferase